MYFCKCGNQRSRHYSANLGMRVKDRENLKMVDKKLFFQRRYLPRIVQHVLQISQEN